MANKTLVFFFFLFFCCCISFLFFMYSSSSHEEPDWLFFFLSESPSKIQAQPVDGPSMWVSTCSFVVLHRIFSSFCLWSLLDSFLPSCCSVVSYVLERVRERETETESECLCLCVCVWIVPRDSVGLLSSCSSSWSFLLSKNLELVAILSCTCLRVLGGVSVVSTSTDHLQRASEGAREASTRNEHAATTSSQATVVVVVIVPSSASPSSTPYTTASILSFFGGFPAIKPKTIIPTKIFAFKPNPKPQKTLEKKSQTQKLCWEFNGQISVFTSNKKVAEMGLFFFFGGKICFLGVAI